MDFSSELPFSFYEGPVLNMISPDHGPMSGETLITLQGTFINAESVICTFGDQEVFVLVWNQTTVQCRTPIYYTAGVASVAVKIHDGSSSIISDSMSSFSFIPEKRILDIFPA